MSLADILKTYKKPKDTKTKTIRDKLDRYLLKRSKSTTKDIGRGYEKERDMTVHHPSSLSSNECLRYHVFKWLKTEKTNGGIEPRIQRLFDVGHDFGYRMTGYFWEMGILLGGWKCIECDHEWFDLENPSPTECPNCNTELEIWYNLHYIETPIIDKERNIAGHCDNILKRDFGRQIIELKTIKGKPQNAYSGGTYFQDLNEPKQSHRLQANWYLFGAGNQYGRESEHDFKHGLVIYINKNNQRLKEFSISMMPEFATKINLKAEMVDDYLEDNEIPDRETSMKKSKPPCKWCDWKDVCWSDPVFEEVDNREEGDNNE